MIGHIVKANPECRSFAQQMIYFSAFGESAKLISQLVRQRVNPR